MQENADATDDDAQPTTDAAGPAADGVATVRRDGGENDDKTGETVTVTLGPALADRARFEATQADMSLAEFVADAVRRRVINIDADLTRSHTATAQIEVPETLAERARIRAKGTDHPPKEYLYEYLDLDHEFTVDGEAVGMADEANSTGDPDA